MNKLYCVRRTSIFNLGIKDQKFFTEILPSSSYLAWVTRIFTMVLVFLNIQNSCTWTFSSNAARIAQSCYKVLHMRQH